MSGETCLTLPFRCCFAIVKSRRIVRIESEKSGNTTRNLSIPKDCILSITVFPCGYGFNQTKKGEKAVNVSLFTVRHVFVELVKGMESGIRNPESEMRNPESGMRNSQPFSFYYLWKIISHLQYFFVSLFFKIIEYYARSLRSLLSLL